MLQQAKYKDVLQRARKRYAAAVAFERDIRFEAQLDLAFLSGDQWSQKERNARENGPSPRPCLVFNKCLPPVTQLGNQARQNKPSIKVSPVDSAGDPDTAKVYEGMVRHIEYDSDAEVAYDTALFYAAGCSFGFWRYGCEYTDAESFDQDIKTIAVDDPFSIYLDFNAKKLDRSDAKWGFVLDHLPNEIHEGRFGKDVADLSSDFAKELEEEGWQDADSKMVAEYWEIETTKKTLRLEKQEDGTLHKQYLEDLTPEEIAGMEWELDDKGEPKERTVEIPVVWQYIINGAAVLEEPTKWDGTTIPIVAVTGLEMIVRGKRKIFSMTRFARDPQMLLNYYKTMEAETIGLAPKPKWVGTVGQFKSKRKDWQRANIDSAAFLEVDPVAVGEKPAPMPEWHTFDPPVQALSIGAAAAADDIKGATGFYDPSLGQTKADQSGVAIGKLQRQGDVSNFHFMDNLARALKRGGRIIVELIPKKYDTAREVRIIGEDQKQRIVTVNAPFIDHDGDGKVHHHELDKGKYDVRVEQGTSYTTQRQETREMIMALAQGNPEVWQLAADIFFENQDFVGADRLAKRFKRALPPQFQDEDASADVPPQIQAQMAQDKQAMTLMRQQNSELMEMLKNKVLDLESKERIAAQNNQAKMEAAEAVSKSAAMNRLAELDHNTLQAELDRRADLLQTHLGLAADVAQTDAELQAAQQAQATKHAHEQGMAAQDQEATAGLQAQDQQADAASADQQRQHEADQAQQAQAASLAAAKAQPKPAPSAAKAAKPKTTQVR